MTICALRDLIEVSLDGEWGTSEVSEGTERMLCIRGTDFAGTRIGDLSRVPLRYIPEGKARRKKLQPWDIVIEVAGGTKDQPTGRTLLVRPSLLTASPLGVTCASFSRFIRLRHDLCDPQFVFWYLQNLYATGAMRAYHTQHTGVARFQWTTFAEREPLKLPDLPRQERIAGILSAYDDLIENCERRIRALDEMARTLYREWFVLFRYPGHEKVPLVESESGRAPRGWKVTQLARSAMCVDRGISPVYDEVGPSVVINQRCIRDRRLDLTPARRQSKAIPSEKLVLSGDVLINSTGVGTLGRVAQVLADLGACTVDTHVTIVRPSPDVDAYWFGMTLLELELVFERKGVGATGQTELSRAAIGETPICVPPTAFQQLFSDLVRPMRDSTVHLQQRITTLRRTRDILLPRLLSGQLDVGAAA